MTNQRLLGFRNVMHILKTVLKNFDKVIRGGGLLSDLILSDFMVVSLVTNLEII